MRLKLLVLIVMSSLLVNVSPVFADNLTSTNYKLIDPEIESVNGTASSTNYKSLFEGGQGISQGSISSNLYGLRSGQGYTFMANVPKIICFETTTTLSNTTCTTLNSTNGMQGVCGVSGCYDRAYIEIDTQSNPSDTLYSIEISPDNFVTRYIVSGTTRTLKTYSTKNSADYLTKAQWESSPWNQGNILGLIPNTAYQVRVTALQGDYTESDYSPTKTATTATTYAMLDLDIGSNFASESNAPYTYNLGILSSESYYLSTSAYIKTDFETNAQSGVEVYVQDQYSGLKSVSTNYLLTSSSEDLSVSANGDGFGLQSFDKTQAASSRGYTVLDPNFVYSGALVGAVSSLASSRIACSITNALDACSTGTGTWINGGSVLIKVGARASFNAPPANDYTDQLKFTLIGNW